MSPAAMRNSKASPIWPAAPVTATRTGAFMDDDSFWGCSFLCGSALCAMPFATGASRTGCAPAGTDSRQFGEKFGDTVQAGLQLGLRAGVGNAHRTRLAEGRAVHAGHT